MNDNEVSMLKEHLPYELDMLEWCYAADLSALRQNPAFRNMAIEGFWLHARNLYEFMTKKGHGTGQGVAAAQDFVDGKFIPDLPFEMLDDKMNIQISHLQYERPSSTDGKLGGYDMGRFREAINRAVKLFEEKMHANAREIWIVRNPPAYVQATGPAAATNVVQEAQAGYTGYRDLKGS